MRNVPGYSQKRISCGKAFEGEQVIIDCPNETQNGEIIIKGRHVFMGYINKREKTSETIDQNGFYHTGEVGYMDKDGFLTITGRIKELLITRGGENVAPVLIENNIKKELGDVISDVVVIGDNEKFLTCLITLRVNIVDEMPTQEIDDLVQFNLFKNEGIDVKMIEDAINNKRFNKYIEDGIKKANKKTVSNAQTVKKFAILQNNFTVPGGELTPTLKKKRPIINRKNQNSFKSS